MKWKAFSLTGENGLFNLHSTRNGIDSKNLNLNGEKIYPYVTRTERNNGIQSFVPKQDYSLNPGNTISIGLDTQTVFFQPHSYYTGQNIQVLSGEGINKNTALFIIPVLKEQLKNLNWGGNGATLGRLSVKQIMMPIKDDGSVDWNYIEEFVQTQKSFLYSSFSTELNHDIVDFREINDVELKRFKIKNIFSSFQNGQSKGLNHLTKNGNVPYIGATNRNNGVTNFIKVDSEHVANMVQNGNCVVFIRNGVGSIGFSIYKAEKFIATSDVTAGYSEKLNKYTGTFITTMADTIRPNYTFGYKRTPKRLRNEEIYLPVTKDDEIDWSFMEQYMMRLENDIMKAYED